MVMMIMEFEEKTSVVDCLVKADKTTKKYKFRRRISVACLAAFHIFHVFNFRFECFIPL
jgi:hypothetical protein